MRILLYVLPIEALWSVIPNYWLAFLVVRSNCQQCGSMVFPFNNLLFLGHPNYFVMPLQNLRSRAVALKEQRLMVVLQLISGLHAYHFLSHFKLVARHYRIRLMDWRARVVVGVIVVSWINDTALIARTFGRWSYFGKLFIKRHDMGSCCIVILVFDQQILQLLLLHSCQCLQDLLLQPFRVIAGHDIRLIMFPARLRFDDVEALKLPVASLQRGPSFVYIWYHEWLSAIRHFNGLLNFDYVVCVVIDGGECAVKATPTREWWRLNGKFVLLTVLKISIELVETFYSLS